MRKIFTEKEYEILKTQAAEVLEKLNEGESARDIMAKIYVENMDNKTLKQGYLMADAAIQGTRKFDEDYQEAQKDIESFIRKYQDLADEGKTCQERCEYWLKLSAALSAAELVMGENPEDRERLLQDLNGLNVPKEEATPEREQALRGQAYDLIRNSGIMLQALMSQEKGWTELADAGETAEMLIEFGKKDQEYRAIVTMLAYTKIKTGEFEDIPEEITMAEVASLVCAQIEQIRIAEAVGNGTLAVDVAAALLSILGCVVIVSLTLAMAGLPILIAAFELVSLEGVLMLPAAMMMICGVLTVLGEEIGLMEKAGRVLSEKGAVAVKKVADGIKALTCFLNAKVLPAIVKKAGEIRAHLSKKTAEEEDILDDIDADVIVE